MAAVAAQNVIVVEIRRSTPGPEGEQSYSLIAKSIKPDQLIPGNLVIELMNPAPISAPGSPSVIAVELSVKGADVLSWFRGPLQPLAPAPIALVSED